MFVFCNYITFVYIFFLTLVTRYISAYFNFPANEVSMQEISGFKSLLRRFLFQVESFKTHRFLHLYQDLDFCVSKVTQRTLIHLRKLAFYV